MAKDWFLAPALDAFFDELNERYPKRDKKSDGSIGDAAHSSRVSDHNPDPSGMVHAIDVDEDGIPLAEIVKFLVNRHKLNLDNRLWYIIYEDVIYSRTFGWAPREYKGSNKHRKHAHFSLRYVDSIEGNRASWLGLFDREDDRYTAWQKVETGKRTISLWDSGDDVKELQRVLNAWYPDVKLTVDGYFGPGTKEAVVYFQGRAELEADGVVGPKSWAKLNFI